MKKFIITRDELTAKKMIAGGFKLVNNLAGSWTFLNVAPKNFSFAEIDKEKYSYTNILCL